MFGICLFHGNIVTLVKQITYLCCYGNQAGEQIWSLYGDPLGP